MVESWKLEILGCNECGGKLEQRDNTMTCRECGKKFEYMNGILFANEISTASKETFDFYNKSGGTSLLERSLNPESTSYYETKAYYKYLTETFSTIDKKAIVLDLGCGDGRNTKWLVSQGYRKIVAVDIVPQGIIKYKNTISKTDQSKILFINSDILNLPLGRNTLDVVLAIEVMYYLGQNYEGGLDILRDLLKPHGFLFCSEATLEGALLYELVSHNIKEFIETWEDKKKFERGPKGSSIRSRVFEYGEVNKILEKKGFHVEEWFGVSAFPNLAINSLKQSDCKMSEELKKNLEIMTEKRLQPFRCIFYKARKRTVEP